MNRDQLEDVIFSALANGHEVCSSGWDHCVYCEECGFLFVWEGVERERLACSLPCIAPLFQNTIQGEEWR